MKSLLWHLIAIYCNYMSETSPYFIENLSKISVPVPPAADFKDQESMPSDSTDSIQAVYRNNVGGHQLYGHNQSTVSNTNYTEGPVLSEFLEPSTEKSSIEAFAEAQCVDNILPTHPSIYSTESSHLTSLPISDSIPNKYSEVAWMAIMELKIVK